MGIVRINTVAEGDIVEAVAACFVVFVYTLTVIVGNNCKQIIFGIIVKIYASCRAVIRNYNTENACILCIKSYIFNALAVDTGQLGMDTVFILYFKGVHT